MSEAANTVPSFDKKPGGDTASMAGGLSASLRDLARFGELMRRDGEWNGRQLVPASVVAEVRKGDDPSKFAKAGYTLLPGYSYRNMWWVSHNELDAYEGPDYRRWTVVAELADGSEAQVQAYICLIADTDGLEPIPHGDFARFVAETGRKVFGT